MSPRPGGTEPAPPVPIDDPDDPRIAVYRNVRERDLVGREGLFIAEGASVLAVLLSAPIEKVSILVEASRVERLPILAQRGSTPLYTAPQGLLDTIAGFHLHRGILAAGKVPPSARLAEVLPQGPLRLVVLAGLSNHDNVGGVYRNAAAFAARAVVIDPECADPFYRKAIRVGVGAPLIVPTVRAVDLLATLGELAAAGVTPYALTPQAERGLADGPLAPRAAFLMGTEGPGLPAALLAAAQPLAVRIAPGFDSLNVAATSAIALHAHAAQHGLGSWR